VFCVVDGRKDKSLATETVLQKLEEAKLLGMQDVVFSGGDCTVRKDIIDIIKVAKDKGFISVQIQTNGRRLADTSFLKELIESGVTEFSISLHGSTPEIHDSLTGVKGSFRQTTQGIQNIHQLLGDQAIVITNTVITRSNLTDLANIAYLLSSLQVSAYQFAYIHAQGRAESVFEDITPYKSEAKPYIIDALNRSIENGYGVGRVMVEGYPYCFLRGYECFYSDLYIPHSYTRNKGDETIDPFPIREARLKGECCNICTFTALCYGPWREYPQRRGWNEFIPIVDVLPSQVIPPEFLENFTINGKLP